MNSTSAKFFILSVILLVLAGFVPHRLVKTRITPEISVNLPTDLMPMSPEDIAQRYPSARAPLGAYTNELRVVDFSVNQSATQWQENDVPLAADFFKAGIANLYDRVDFLNHGIRQINQKEFIFFEFNSRMNGDKRALGNAEPILKYHYVAYLVQPNRTLVFTFTCPRELQAEWQPTAHEVFSTLRVR